jgi:hypothetical protein
MKPILKIMLPLACCLVLFTCKNYTQKKSDEQEDVSVEETTDAFDDELITGDNSKEPQLKKPHYDLSTMKESAYAKKLMELVYYEKIKKSEEGHTGYSNYYYQLYPFGWSKKGNFAYAEVGNTEGELEIRFTIKNMNTNKILWSKSNYYAIGDATTQQQGYISINTTEFKSDTEYKPIQYAWLVHENVLLKVLEKAGIKFNPAVELLKQASYKDITFEITHAEVENGGVEEFKYTLKSNKYDPQFLSQTQFESPKTYISGILKSPYSETIAVVVEQKQYFFEGDSNIVPILIGYKLN